MKRTFGRFMSLLLVLAMVLAMVPAALAANQAYSVEPNSTITIKTSIIKEGSVSWSSSDTSVAKVEGSTTEATVTGVKASNTAVRITATGTLANGRSHSEYFTVYVRDAYTLTLALSNSNINGTVALNQGDTRTLTATVTVGSSGEYVTDQIASLLSGYFRGSNSDWAAQAQSMFDILCSGFADYANENNFIYTDYSQAASATNNLVNSPYSSIS